MFAEEFGEIPLLGLVKGLFYVSRIPFPLNIFLSICGTEALGDLLSVATDDWKKPVFFSSSSLYA